MAGHDYLHDVALASNFGMLGSIDSNTGSPDLGWDTDQFPMDVKNSTLLMKVWRYVEDGAVPIRLSVLQIIIDQGGLAPGGLNFDCKVRRESIDIRDMFVAHIGKHLLLVVFGIRLCSALAYYVLQHVIGAMDTLARGLRNAAKIVQDGVLSRMLQVRCNPLTSVLFQLYSSLQERYLSFSNTDIGRAIDGGTSTLEDCEVSFWFSSYRVWTSQLVIGLGIRQEARRADSSLRTSRTFRSCDQSIYVKERRIRADSDGLAVHDTTSNEGKK